MNDISSLRPASAAVLLRQATRISQPGARFAAPGTTRAATATARCDDTAFARLNAAVWQWQPASDDQTSVSIDIIRDERLRQ
jgi:hypothetical protein